MFYTNGTQIALGDIVTVPIPNGLGTARVVMVGDTYEHLEIDQRFVRWVNAERKLDANSVVVEWVDENPFANNDPAFAPVGNYLFSPVDQRLLPIRTASG